MRWTTITRLLIVVIVGVVTAIDRAGPAHAGEPCEDETGFLFKGGPSSFVDGIRPQGYCAAGSLN